MSAALTRRELSARASFSSWRRSRHDGRRSRRSADRLGDPPELGELRGVARLRFGTQLVDGFLEARGNDLVGRPLELRQRAPELGRGHPRELLRGELAERRGVALGLGGEIAEGPADRRTCVRDPLAQLVVTGGRGARRGPLVVLRHRGGMVLHAAVAKAANGDAAPRATRAA